MSNKSEVVVITGASAGVGRATTMAFARRGASLGLIARDRTRLEAAKEETERAGGRALVLPGDVADADHLEKAAEQVEQEFGLIDIWINNAMTTVFSPFQEMSAAEFKRVTEVTYLSYVYGTMSALKRMAPRNRGVIVQVGSALAYRAIPLQSAYCGAKHGVRAFTDSLRAELAHDKVNVRLTMVQLPAVNTPQFSWCRTRLPRQPQPVPPIYQPELAAEAVMWAAYHERRELFVGSPTAATIIASKFFPGIVDWYLARTGYDSQQAGRQVSPNRPDNLFAPAAGDFGAHGEFNERAEENSWQYWASTRLGWPALTDTLFGAGRILNSLWKFAFR